MANGKRKYNWHLIITWGVILIIAYVLWSNVYSLLT